MANERNRRAEATSGLKEQVVSINRVTKVVKGGKNLSFSALVVIGDPQAKTDLRKINVLETTIPHPVTGRFGAGRVLLKPAPQGTGVIAGGPVRAVIEAVGIPNVLTKSLGTHNPHNVVKATIAALELLRDKAVVADMRGIAIEKM